MSLKQTNSFHPGFPYDREISETVPANKRGTQLRQKENKTVWTPTRPHSLATNAVEERLLPPRLNQTLIHVNLGMIEIFKFPFHSNISLRTLPCGINSLWNVSSFSQAKFLRNYTSALDKSSVHMRDSTGQLMVKSSLRILDYLVKAFKSTANQTDGKNCVWSHDITALLINKSLFHQCLVKRTRKEVHCDVL